MKKLFVMGLLCLSINFPRPSRADMFGGDVAVLTQILANALQQLAQLRQILSTGSDTLGLLRDVNRGINDSLNLLQTISPNLDPGVLKQYKDLSAALKMVEDIYGTVKSSKDQTAYQHLDRNVAEIVSFNNKVYDYVGKIDHIAESIKSFSHQTSPGGAQKLTAQSMGIMLELQNESLRAQAQGLKLQAQVAAMNNLKNKAKTENMLESARSLTQAMKARKEGFQIPRL